MTWEMLSSTVLDAAADELSSGTIATKKYLRIESFIIASGDVNASWVLNDDENGNYANRYQDDGGTASADANDTRMDYDIGTLSGISYNLHDVANIDGVEKFYIGRQQTTSGTGSGTAPARRTWNGKWANTDQITSVKIIQNAAGSMDTGSYINIFGSS